jgi:phage pi2 protein 07
VELSSSIYKGPREPFLSAGAIYLSLNLRKLLHNQISIKEVSLKEARLMLHKYRDGSKNFELKPQKKDTVQSNSKFSFDAKKIKIRNTSFTFINEERGQRFNFTLKNIEVFLNKSENGFLAEVIGKAKVGGLIFKSEKGAFFKNNSVYLNLKVFHNKHLATISVLPPSKVEIDERDYNTVCLVNYKNEKRLAIWVESQTADVAAVAKSLNPQIQNVLSNFHVKKPVSANALIVVKLGAKQEPILNLQVSSIDNDLSIGHSKIPYSNLSFNLKVISIDAQKQFGDGDHGLIKVSPISGNIYDFPFTASVTLNGLRNSLIKIEAGLLIEAEKIDFDIANRIDMEGSCTAKINYSGPANKLNKNDFLGPEMQLSAALNFKDFRFQPKNSNHYFKFTGLSTLNKHDLDLKNLKVFCNGGLFVLNGRASNFTNYILGHSPVLKARLDLVSERFDLSPYLGKTQSKGIVKPKKRQKSPLMNHDLELQLSIRAKQLKVNSLMASQATIRADYLRHVLHLRQVDMNVCGGKLEAKGKLANMKRLSSEMDVRNVDVNKLFEQMNNFGQESIRAEHLAGTLNMKGKFSADLDEQKQIQGPSMNGEIALVLSNGRLMNFEPLQNISKYVFRNRDFKDISFTELNEKFYLKGQAMKIEEMELASDVMNLFVSGVFHFKENSTINVLVPWSNLKHRGKDYEAKTLGQEASDAKGVKLNFSGPPKKMKMGVGYKKVEF